MTTANDQSQDLYPLERPFRPERVNYANGVLLDERDFNEEQLYFRGRLSRVLSYLHGQGTVAGLEVKESEPGSHIIKVEPGMAIDRIGRMIELPVPFCIRIEPWFTSQDTQQLETSYLHSAPDGETRAVVADIFLKFKVCESGRTPFFGGGNADATDAFTTERWVEGGALELVVRTESNPGVPTHRLPSVDPAHPLSREDALAALKTYKYQHAWRETSMWNSLNNRIHLGPEHVSSQNGTEVLLARLRLPATPAPITYDTNQSIIIDDSVRLFSYSAFELDWLNFAAGGN